MMLTTEARRVYASSTLLLTVLGSCARPSIDPLPETARPAVIKLLALYPGESVRSRSDSAPLVFPGAEFIRTNRVPPAQNPEDPRTLTVTTVVLRSAPAEQIIYRTRDLPELWPKLHKPLLGDSAGAVRTVVTLLELTDVDKSLLLRAPKDFATERQAVLDTAALDRERLPSLRIIDGQRMVLVDVRRLNGIYRLTFGLTGKDSLTVQDSLISKFTVGW